MVFGGGVAMRGCFRFGVGVFLLVVLLAGCESTVMQKRNQRRLENIQRTIDMLAQNEVDRPAKLVQFIEDIESKHQLDLFHCAENQKKLKSWIEEDFEDWERQRPIICQYIRDELAGDWASFDRTWPDILD